MTTQANRERNLPPNARAIGMSLRPTPLPGVLIRSEIFLHGLIKKSQKTPDYEMAVVVKRMKGPKP